MISCLETRRVLQQMHYQNSADITQHLQTCSACRSYASRLQHEMAQLQSALDIPVPDQLAERILLHVQLQEHHVLKRNRPAVSFSAWKGYLARFCSHCVRPTGMAEFAIVAVTVLALWGLPLLSLYDQGANWSEVILAHTISEDSSLSKVDTVPIDTLKQALKHYQLSTNENLGLIRYVGHCALPNGRGLHVVINTREWGELTLILPPKGVDAAASLAQREGYYSQIIRLNHTSIGIVSRQPQHMAAIQHHLRQRVFAVS